MRSPIDPAVSVRIGINPITWSNDDLPALGAHIPLSRCLAEGKRAGYAGFELGHKFPRAVEPLRAALAAHRLSLVSGWFSGALAGISVAEEIARIEPHLQLLTAMRCQVLVYCDTSAAVHGEHGVPLAQRPQLTQAQWPAFCARLNRLAAHCLSRGVQLAYHHHMGSIVETTQDIARLLDHTGPELGLALDTGHLDFAGGDPVALYRQYKDRVVHIHLKDTRKAIVQDAKNRNLSFLQAVLNGAFTVPGDGDLDYPSLFAELGRAGYRGWLVVEAEQDPAIAPPLRYASLGAKHVKQLCASHGLEV